jgi:hypothetical protein
MNSKQIAVGSSVSFSAEVQEMNPALVNQIFEVRDARVRADGSYGLSLAPVTLPESLNCTHFDVSARLLVSL